MGVTPTSLPLRFSGKTRDVESALDYFGARYYAGRIGQFTTVDPVLNVEAALTDPQRWNRYSYVLNRPLIMSDPDGREAGYVYLRSGQMIAPIKGMSPITGKLWLGTVAGGAAIATGAAGWRALVGCALSLSCQRAAIDLLEDAAGGPPENRANR